MGDSPQWQGLFADSDRLDFIRPDLSPGGCSGAGRADARVCLLPTIVALFLYGLLPIVRNTIAGLRAVPPDVLDAAYGMGMSRMQALVRVEIPLAARVILAGVRISVIINIATAMIGAVIGAGGLGSPIIAGLVQDNLALIIEGAVPAAILAILADQLLANVEGSFSYAADRV